MYIFQDILSWMSWLTISNKYILYVPYHHFIVGDPKNNFINNNNINNLILGLGGGIPLYFFMFLMFYFWKKKYIFAFFGKIGPKKLFCHFLHFSYYDRCATLFGVEIVKIWVLSIFLSLLIHFRCCCCCCCCCCCYTFL